MTALRAALVLGTGLAELPFPVEQVEVETPWGGVALGIARGSRDLVVLPRHGLVHKPAHAIESKANVEALARARVERVVALNTVGALDPALAPGSLVVPDDALALRPHATFHDARAVHVDMSEPYCPQLRGALGAAARAEGARVADRGVYAATTGPRLETPAEVRALRALGGTVVGMTGWPEAALAREKAMCYASLCLVTNAAAGAGPPLQAEEIRSGARALAPLALRVALRAVDALPATRAACRCARALEGAAL